MRKARHWKVALSAAVSACLLASVNPSLATDCDPLLERFNQAIDTAQEAAAQALVDEIAGSADCGQFQTRAQQRLAALRLSAAQILMARGRPLSEYERLLTASETTEVLWQASATLGEVRLASAVLPRQPRLTIALSIL